MNAKARRRMDRQARRVAKSWGQRPVSSKRAVAAVGDVLPPLLPCPDCGEIPHICRGNGGLFSDWVVVCGCRWVGADSLLGACAEWNDLVSASHVLRRRGRNATFGLWIALVLFAVAILVVRALLGGRG